MKKLILWLIVTLSVALTSCSRFHDTSENIVEPEEEQYEEGAFWHESRFYRTVVSYKTSGRGAWHRVWFRIDGRSRDSFENNVDCYNDLRIGDSILVEEVFSSVTHYYNITKITH